MAGFIEYINSLPSLLTQLSSTSKLRVTIGNESCDLDSIVCALSYAHYWAVTGGNDWISLPLLSCRRDEFVLRTEAIEVFSQVGVQSDCLIFADDLPLDKLKFTECLEVTLVDHNHSSSRFPSNSVVQVIDHHELSPSTCVGCEGVRVTVEWVGSCATLTAAQLLSNPQSYSISPTVATLLLSAILLDTGDLLLEGRVTDSDKEVAGQLLESMPEGFDSHAHFKTLFKARFDNSTLTSMQVLGRDFKQTRVSDKYSIGFSSVTDSLVEFVSRDGFKDDVTAFYQQQSLDVLILLGIYIPSGDHDNKRRHIAVYQSDGELPESIVSMLEASEQLQCVRVEGVGFEGVLLEQRNVKMSRKHILPLVAQFVADVERGHSPGATPAVPLEPVVTVVTAQGEVPIPEYSTREEAEEVRAHRLVSVGGAEHVIDMTLVEPYRNIIQHAGYVGEERLAVMVVSSCHLPPRTLHNYKQVAQELFYYVMSVLDRIIVDQYMIVYLHSGAPPNSRPSLQLLRRFYELVDRRFRKQLTALYIVHPTFLVKSILTLARPFISSKFWRKVHFVPTLSELPAQVAIDDGLIPTAVKNADSAITRHRPPAIKYSPSETKGN